MTIIQLIVRPMDIFKPLQQLDQILFDLVFLAHSGSFRGLPKFSFLYWLVIFGTGKK
jgi:hypothetical protein